MCPEMPYLYSSTTRSESVVISEFDINKPSAYLHAGPICYVRVRPICARIRNRARVTGAISGAAFGEVRPPVYQRMMKELAVIKEAPVSNIARLSELSGVPMRTLQRDLRFLRAKQMLIFVGTRKTGGYELTEAGRKELGKGLAR